MIKCGSGLAGTAFLIIADPGSAYRLFLAPPEKKWYTIGMDKQLNLSLIHDELKEGGCRTE